MSYFGTDGIRGEFGQFPITPQFALQLGFAAGKVLKNLRPNKKPIVVMGKDTRLSGYILESALQAGLNAAGVYVHLLGPLPTPAIAHLTRALHADAGIVISASHNPYFDNGIKFFSGEGKKLSNELQQAINAELANELFIEDSANLGKSVRVKDANGRYIEFCKSTFPYHYDLRNLKIVVDCANGAAYNVGPAVFRELGAKVGDRYVLQALEENGWNTGGEPSGHVLTLDKSTTGDAIIAALQVLTVMVEQQKTLDQLLQGFELFPQILVNVRLDQMIDPFAVPALVAEFDQAEEKMQGRGRILIRKSGTEPVIRVMVEGNDLEEVTNLANHLADQIRLHAKAA